MLTQNLTCISIGESVVQRYVLGYHFGLDAEIESHVHHGRRRNQKALVGGNKATRPGDAKSFALIAVQNLARPLIIARNGSLLDARSGLSPGFRIVNQCARAMWVGEELSFASIRE
jgi:hypothetical protein